MVREFTFRNVREAGRRALGVAVKVTNETNNPYLSVPPLLEQDSNAVLPESDTSPETPPVIEPEAASLPGSISESGPSAPTPPVRPLLNEGSTDCEGAHRTHAQQTMDLCQDIAVVRGSDGLAYARVPVREHIEACPIDSKRFKDTLARRFFHAYGRPVGHLGLTQAIDTLRAQAIYGTTAQPVALRTGEHQEGTYIDLGDDNWSVVRMTSKGWSILAEPPPMLFRRSTSTRSLPLPERSGRIEQLRPFVNVSTDTDFALLVAWMVHALLAKGPYPVLTLVGEQGSAKSSTARCISMLIDPSSTPLRTLPTTERDLVAAVQNRWVLAFDNLSGLTRSMSDRLCTVATGIALTTRELFTNNDESVVEACRPVMMTSIEDVVARGDLADRALVLHLPPIADLDRRDEVTLRKEFAAALPSIFGGLLDLCVVVLRDLPAVQLPRSPRMADYARVVWALGPHLGVASGVLLEALLRERQAAFQTVLDGEPIVAAIHRLLTRSVGEQWRGSPTKLFTDLARVAPQASKQSHWPKTPGALGNALRRVAPLLRQEGMSVEQERTSLQRTIVLSKTNVSSPVTSSPVTSSPASTGASTVSPNSPTDHGAGDQVEFMVPALCTKCGKVPPRLKPGTRLPKGGTNYETWCRDCQRAELP